MKTIKYPEEAKKAGIEGKVYVQFIVDKNGKINQVQALKGIGGGCDEEAVMVVANGPDLEPGLVEGKAVNTRLILPVTFKLDGKDDAKKVGKTNKPANAEKENEKGVAVVGYKE
jgi:TonB family protein